jgi:hypothetical protein
MLIDVHKLNATPILHIRVIHVFRQRMFVVLSSDHTHVREDVGA